MTAEKREISDSAVPEMLRRYYRTVIKREEEPDRRLSFSPSVVPVGSIRCSAFDGKYFLWFASPADGRLCRAALLNGDVLEYGYLAEDKPIAALYPENGVMWALTEDAVYSFPVPADRPAPVPEKRPLQKTPRYFDRNADIPGAVKKALCASRKFREEKFLRCLGDVAAVCSDGQGGRCIALKNGVLHIAAQPAFDRRKIELYAGGRYIFGGDESVFGVCADENGLWIQNGLGYVHVERKRMSLFEKAEHYDRLAWELQSTRGSLCDIYYTAENYGNDGALFKKRRYSTNNDALWSVFHAIGEAQRYSVMRREGNRREAEKSRKRLVRITENVLLQSHIHGLGNGFTCRGYVSAKDKAFIRDGKLDTDGLWFCKDGIDEAGKRVCRCVDTPLAHSGQSLLEGRNFLLTDEVKARLQTTASSPIDGGFTLTAPISAEVPKRLAKLYEEPDPYHPDTYPASGDSDIIFKCDTSSEEVIAAFVQYYYTWKHLISVCDDPDAAELRGLIRQTAAATLTHLLDNGFCLRDIHGNPTQWGKWFVDYFARQDGSVFPWRHPYYAYTDGPLNAAEWMCILRVAMLILEGGAEYREVYRRARCEYEKTWEAPFDGVTNGAGYASLLMQYRRRLSEMSKARFDTDDYVQSVNYSDEPLALISYAPLIELENNPERNRLLHEGLDEWWDNMRREDNPVYTFVYAALNPGRPVGFSGALDALNRLPLYLRAFPVRNSARNDVIVLDGVEKQLNVLLPVDERRLHKTNNSPFSPDTEGETGADMYKSGYLYSGYIFTLPYWTARYYGLADMDQGAVCSDF